MSAQVNYLFVYGTLMQGFENPFATKLRAGSDFVEKGCFLGNLYRVDWYPGAIYEPESKTLVWGEVYRLFDFEKLITELDMYEGLGEDETTSQYLRRRVSVLLDNGQELICWTYIYNQSTDNLLLIEGGRFRAVE